MKEVKIYYSLWRMLLLISVCILFVLGGIFILHMHRNVFHLVVGWGSILVFGFLGILLLCSFLKERLFNQPHLAITDEELIYRRVKTSHVRFADVESFKVREFNGHDFIAINYKPNVERQKMQKASIFSYLYRSMNKRLIDAPESISSTDISMKADELCHLLNERLKQS
ncbi:MAG: hypothetical protein J6W97_03815 [Bacteroidaceae bacterium]|nr:hypothetical protein [Bacteroidaceae bacterium]